MAQVVKGDEYTITIKVYPAEVRYVTLTAVIDFSRPSRVTKRRWRQAGRPASLRAWARAMAPADRHASRWLANKHNGGTHVARRLAVPAAVPGDQIFCRCVTVRRY